MGLTIQDHVRVFRFKRQVRLWQRVMQICAEAGIEPKRVPLKLLAPMVESASLEDDDDLQDVWANLLANAADPRAVIGVAAAFSGILRELSSRDVKFLDALYTHATSEEVTRHYGGEMEEAVFETFELLEVYSKAGLSRHPDLAHALIGRMEKLGEDIDAEKRDFDFTLDVLTRQLLLNTWIHQPTVMNDVGKFKHFYAFTIFGICFVRACQAPAK